MSKPYKTIVDALIDAKKRPLDKIAVKFKSKNGSQKSSWQNKNWPEVVTDIEVAIGILKSKGVKKTDRIAIYAETCYEWLVFDLAILSIGAITIPIYPNLLANEVFAVVNDSGCSILIYDSEKKLNQFTQENKNQKIDYLQITTSIENAKSNQKKDIAIQWDKLASNLKTEDIATIVYTSGSMGDSKGVVLAHEQVMSEVLESFESMGITMNDTTLTFLPYAHIFGRLEMWGSVCFGNTLAFAESPDTLKKNFLEIKPTVFIAVPRVFEKIYVTMINQIRTHKIQKIIFNQAKDFGLKLTEARLQKKPLPLHSFVQYKIFDKLVFSHIRDLFGGRLRFTVSGGAPLSLDINRFFWSCGIPILEGYGLSETTGAVTVNLPYDYELGTVGKPIGDVQIKIAEDGEVLINSKKVMREYLNRAEETKQNFDNGFFKTGDFGEITEKGFLKITGRKKELIKTSGGKYIAPQRIEQKIQKNTLIEHAVVIGDQKKYAIALLTLNKDSQKKYTEAELKNNIRKWISEVNNELASFESIKNFEILNTNFSVDGGELTPSLKLKRKVIEAKFKSEIDSLY